MLLLSAVAACDNSTSEPTGSAQDAASADAGSEPITATDASRPRDAAQDAASRPPDAASATGDGGSPSDASSEPDAALPVGELETLVYLGGYDTPVRTYELDRESGALAARGTPVMLGANPTFITHSRDGKYLYIANEVYSGNLTVAALSDQGLPSLLEQEPADGPLVFTELHPNGKFVLATSYNEAFVVVYPIANDGKLNAFADKKTFAKPGGADSAQTHSVRVSPDGKWVYVPNKARNEIAQFSIDGSTGKLTPLSTAVVASSGGPRHIALTSTGSHAYLMTEGSNELVAYSIGNDGRLSEIDRKSTLPSGFNGGSTGAHVLVHPNDNFVYASNRGHDSIAVFGRGGDGKLTFVQHAMTTGPRPRNFDIDREGKFLVVANQGNDGQSNGSAIVFGIDASTGKLNKQGSGVGQLKTPAAVSIVTRAKP